MNKQHRGYAANLTETVDEKGSVITDYQYEVNTHSDASFIKEAIGQTEATENPVTLIADGAYSGEENTRQAAEKNIILLTTGLLGRKSKKILGEFELTEDERGIKSCPAGHSPKSCCYISQTESVRISFHCGQCQGCPRQNKCKPEIGKRTAVLIFSLKSRKKRPPPQGRWAGRLHNGIKRSEAYIFANGNSMSKAVSVRIPSNNYYCGRHDFLVNMGYHP